MHPLVSGLEAKRYVAPVTETWLLFPYEHSKSEITLIPADELKSKYPKAGEYLLSVRKRLENREARTELDGTITGPVHDDQWYRYVYPKSLDKQHVPKLIVAQTVPSMRVCFDEVGAFALNNVRVNGILPAEGVDPWFLLGVLNAPVADFVFRRIAKPKDGNWFEANRQFIAPLPIAPAKAGERAAVAGFARELQRLHTRRRDILDMLERRLDGAARVRRPETWLLHGLSDRKSLQSEAPIGLDLAGKRGWAKKEYETRLSARYDTIRPRLRSGATLDATIADGELAFVVDGVPVVDRVFVSAAEAAFVLAQWKVLASTLTFSENASAKALCNALRYLVPPGNKAMADQVVAFANELAECEMTIRAEEGRINALVFELYKLTDAERELISKDQRH